nr:ribonuclease H [Tanacetum cinerariifolium]
MASDQNSSDPALECQTMASDQLSSDPAPECQTMASDQNSSDPALECQTMASDQLRSDPAPECQTMASDQNSSDPAPECQIIPLNHDSLSLGIQRQEKVNQAARIVTTSNEMDLLFSLMFDELLNGSSKVVSKSSVISAADAPNQQRVEKGIVELFFVGTEYQLADLFTKALPVERFQYLIRRLCMRCLTPAELEALANEPA